jgi:beta-glucosidase
MSAFLRRFSHKLTLLTNGSISAFSFLGAGDAQNTSQDQNARRSKSRTRITATAAAVAAMCVALSSFGGAQTASGLPWMNTSLTPEQRADMLISRMTLEQKVQQISNDTRPAENPANRPPGCEFTDVGRHIQGIPELGIPTFRMINGGTGVRGGDCKNEPVSTALPSTPAAAATFNPELNRMLGEVLGNETRLDGHQVMLAPGMNLHRVPYGGRNYEYYSEDPYLSGVLASETIKGIQSQGIQATAKHFAVNEQETQRRQMSALVPPRALEELYLLPFEMSVKDAQPGAVMCAFPEVNGTSACSSEDLLKTTLRESWGFGGWVMTDRRALHDTVDSIKAGVDWELSHKAPLFYALDPQKGQKGNPGGEGLRVNLESGKITEKDIDQMLRHRYVQMFKFGQFDTNFDALYGGKPDYVAHGKVAREIAEQAIVLLKNQGNFLPLDGTKVKSIALIGSEWFAGMAKLPPRSTRGNNVGVIAAYTVTPKEGLENVLKGMGSSATVTYDSGEGTESDRKSALALAKKSDVVIVMLGDNPHELCDRETLGFPMLPPADPNFCGWDKIAPGEEGSGPNSGSDLKRNSSGEFDLPNGPAGNNGTKQNRLIAELLAEPGVAQKMVVVLKTEGMVLMPWLNQIPALVEAWHPGEEDGNAVADILFGVRNPSGKLPMTFGNSPAEAAYATTEQFPGVFISPPWWLNRPRLQATYSEGLQMGYRWYEANNVKPVFPFGFGLSYTTFSYSGLAVAPAVDPQTSHNVLNVTYTVTNTGKRDGAEASQVYVTLPPAANEPSKRLVGFQKVDLAPGASQQVTVTIDPSASNHPLSYWVPNNDAPVKGWAEGTWTAVPGDYVIHVGTSSADTPLVQTVTYSPVDASSKCAAPQPQAGLVCIDGNWGTPEQEPGEDVSQSDSHAAVARHQ